jgi:hypothetical protein
MPTGTMLIDQPFQREANARDVSRALIRLTAAFGEAYRNDEQLTQLMQIEWVRALDGRSAKTIEMAVDYWVATKTKWPKVAEIVELADRYMTQQAQSASARHDVHEARIKPPPTFAGFTMRKSKLRENYNWLRWLDKKHPMIEHSYFAEARFVDYEHIIAVHSGFAKDYILAKFSEELEKHFGRRIIVRVQK